MLYILTNLTNGKKFIGKTNFNEYYLRQLLFSALDNGEHYNKLLQKDWKKHNFKLELNLNIKINSSKTGIYAKLNYWPQRRNSSAGEVYDFQPLRVHCHLWTQTCGQNIPHTSVFSESICL